MILDNWTNLDVLSFISFHILLAIYFIVLLYWLVVENNSWDNSLSWKFFFVVVNVVPVWVFTGDFNLFSCIFVS